MSPRTLRTTRSNKDVRVSLITSLKQEPAAVPHAQEEAVQIKEEIVENAPQPSAYTTLRRSTRSTTRQRSEDPGPSLIPGLSTYAYSTGPPQKRPRLGPTRGRSPEPKVEVKPERSDELGKDLLVKVAPDEKPVAAAKKEKGLPLQARDRAHPEPPRWHEQYMLIKKMREGISAPVDTMGCATPLTMAGLDPKTLRFHVLISLMLSSQTKDAVTSAAVVNLHEALPGGLTADTLAVAPQNTVAEAINKVGFWRRKTDYIQEAARKLLERPGESRGDVPQTIEELCKLKGVGPKMGFLALQVCWDINAGIGVDVHVHRITNRLKWHKPPTKTPEETRVNLESWLPPPLHRPINPLLVGFGQVVCLPVGPRCDVCLLARENLCPSRENVKTAGRKAIGFTFTAEHAAGGPKVEIGYDGGDLPDAVKVELLAEIGDVKRPGEGAERAEGAMGADEAEPTAEVADVKVEDPAA